MANNEANSAQRKGIAITYTTIINPYKQETI